MIGSVCIMAVAAAAAFVAAAFGAAAVTTATPLGAGLVRKTREDGEEQDPSVGHPRRPDHIAVCVYLSASGPVSDKGGNDSVLTPAALSHVPLVSLHYSTRDDLISSVGTNSLQVVNFRCEHYHSFIQLHAQLQLLPRALSAQLIVFSS